MMHHACIMQHACHAHVQHNVAWLVVSEIEAYLERIFLSYVHFASIRSHAILK